MKIRSMRWKEILQLLAFLLFFALTVALNLNCSNDDNPASDPACGSGHVKWDDKTGCRDQNDNRKVPDSCCGH